MSLCIILIFYCRLAFVRLASVSLPECSLNPPADRDSARWKLSPAEVQKRRALFWELFITDCWQVSTSNLNASMPIIGLLTRALQPAASQRSHFPSSTANSPLIRIKPCQTMERPSLAVRLSHISSLPRTNVSYPLVPFWKARFGAECVSAVVQGTLTSRAPKYSIILDLDRKVRDMELPSYAQGPPPQGLGLASTMSHFMPTNYRELSESLLIPFELHAY